MTASRPAVSLRARLTAVVAVGATLVLTAGALLLYGDLSSELSDAVTAELRVRVDDVSATVARGQRTFATGDVIAQVVDRTGRVVAPAQAAPLLTADEVRAALREEWILDRPVPGLGSNARLLARPVRTPAGPVVVVAAASTAPVERARERLALVLGVAGPILVGGIALVGWMLAGAALRPVRRMTREAATISLAEPGRRLPVAPGNDEIAELGHTLNSMLSRIEATVAHERAFVDDASHELRTPIAVLRGELELALLEPDIGDSVARSLHSALEETDRLARLAEGLLVLARADAGQVVHDGERVELLDVARRVVDRLAAGTTVVVDVDGDPGTAVADEASAEQIVTNLVTNALRYARSRVAVRVAHDARTRTVTLLVADDGPGFAPDVEARAFDRFSRSGRDRGRAQGGAGLGLAIVASLARALGGRVAIRADSPLRGAAVAVELPAPP